MPAPILLTGFQPFDGESSNPSWEAVAALDGSRLDGRRVVALQLPVVFGQSLRVLAKALERFRPALALCVGQAGGRSRISLERVAINLQDARIPDNAGRQPLDEPIEARGPAAYFARLPLKACLAALGEAGIPAEISHTAGTYVCNHVFYGLMHALRARRAVRAGFMHIPYSPAQAVRHPGAPSLPVELATAAVRLTVETALARQTDLRLRGGSEC